MKKIVIALFCSLSLAASAQQNTLLSSTFWQDAPSVDAVKAEIAKGNSPSQSTANAFDPIYYAISAQAPIETIKFLLDQPGNTPDKLTHDGRTYLHWAAYRGNTELMEYLLAKGAKIDIQDTHATTPLTFAASAAQQNTKVYDILIAHGANVKKDLGPDGANVLLLAIGNDKDLKLTDYFINKGLDLKSVDAAGNNAFSYAAKSGNIDQLKAVIKKGAAVSPNAMLLAAQSGGARRGGPDAAPAVDPLAMYNYLESLGVKANVTNKTGQNVLHYIVRKTNQVDVVKYFLAKGVNVNQADEDGNTPFILAAASSRDTALINLLLSKTRNINQANETGATALTMAVRGNSPEIIRLLISKGADAKVLDTKGNNLAYYLVDAYRPQRAGGPQGGGERGQGAPGGQQGQGGGRPGGQQGMGGQQGGGERGAAGPRTDDFDTKLQILKESGLNVAATQANGNTLYHLAVAKNDLSLFKRLQPLGIDINAKNKEGMTALHKAALVAKDDTLLKYLLSIGAKKDEVTNFKETAFDLAAENEFLSKNNVSVNFLK